MICNSCNWTGSRDQLVQDKLSKPHFNLDVNSLSYCPKCNAKIFVSYCPITLQLSNNGSIVTVVNSGADLYNRPTFIHLKRLLGFSLTSSQLLIFGYKNYSSQTFTLRFNYSPEIVILLKIIHQLHTQKFRCSPKLINNYQCFGQWSRISKKDEFIPFNSCSFCARYYEWENNKTNGWPLKSSEIHKMLLGKKNVDNNKFANIFLEQKQVSNTVCLCNEINVHPDCSFHKRQFFKNKDLDLDNLINELSDIDSSGSSYS